MDKRAFQKCTRRTICQRAHNGLASMPLYVLRIEEQQGSTIQQHFLHAGFCRSKNYVGGFRSNYDGKGSVLVFFSKYGFFCTKINLLPKEAIFATRTIFNRRRTFYGRRRTCHQCRLSYDKSVTLRRTNMH